MIFKQVPEIIEGVKTQTRRVVKPNEKLLTVEGRKWVDIAFDRHDRRKWVVGSDYAVVPKRGWRGCLWNPNTGDYYNPVGLEIIKSYVPLRIRITSICIQQLQDISKTDALAEGIRYSGYDEYLQCDCYTYTQTSCVWPDPIDAYRHLWSSINQRKGVRWEDNPRVWVIGFEVLK